MKKIISLVLALPLLFVLAFPVHAASKVVGGKGITLSENEVVEGNYYAAGEIIEIFGTVKGDVYAAGGQVFINGNIEGDLLVAGGTLNIGGVIDQDVRAAGGQVIIDAQIRKNLSVAGGNIDIANTSFIGSALHVAGGNVNIFAPITNELLAASGNLTLANSVGGDVQARVGTIRLNSNADIGGDFTYWSEEEAVIDENATISGSTSRQVDTHVRMNMPDDKQLKTATHAFAFGIKFTSLVITLLIGFVVLKLLPNNSSRVAKTMLNRPAASLGYGFLAIIFAPFVFLLLLITLIGIPFALLFVVLFVVYLYLARIYALLALGRYIIKKTEGKTRTGWAFLLGTLVYYVATTIPIAGGLFKIVFLLIALGGTLISDRQTCRLAKKHKVI